MTLPNTIDTALMLALAYMMTIAIILLARPLVARLAGTDWAYALWAVLLVPPLAVFVPSTVAERVHLWEFSAASLSEKFSAPSVLLGAWLIGAFIMGSISIRQSMKLRRELEQSFGSLSAEQMLQVQESCSQANVFPPPATFTSSLLSSPAVMGGFSPTLVLPNDFFVTYSSEETNLVLQHELVHLRRFDVAWNILFRGLRCLLWFVPYGELCEKIFRSDQERSCDHSVVCDLPSKTRAAYASALYKTVIPTSSPAEVAGFRKNRHELVIRTELLSTHRRTHTRSMAGIVALAICASIAVSVSANSNSFQNSAVPTSIWCSAYHQLGL